MKFEAVTIKDIALALGLSTSTVSRALRDSHEISTETKKIILEYADKIGYHPNPIALGLKERRTRSIGIVVCEIANSFFSQVINGIDFIANEKGYNVIITQSYESGEREQMNLQYLTSRSVDGIILSVSSKNNNSHFLKDLHKKGMPIVFFDRIVDDIETYKVTIDNFRGAYDATSHLIRNGYTRIAAINNAAQLSIVRERLAGYKSALTDHGFSVDEALIKFCEQGGMIRDEVETAIQELLVNPQPPDAILATADKLTTGCLRILREKNIPVPGKMGLIGFSNSDLTELLDPSLSVIRQPAFEMGKISMSLLIKMIESKRPISQFNTTILAPELFIRSSSQL